MMIVTGLAIYPLTLFLPDLLAVQSWPMPKWLGHLAMMAVMMPLATYVAIPVISSVFRRWLTSDP